MVSLFLLVLVCFASVVGIFTESPWIAAIAAVGVVGFLVLEFRQLVRVAQGLTLICLALPVGLSLSGQLDLLSLVHALNRAAFLTFFLCSLSFLQAAAGRSPLVLRCGEALVSQPPGRRYLVLTFGAAVFGMLLNLGTLSLLGTMIRNGVEAGRSRTDPQISAIRLKRMTLASVRGFCSIPMWSPVTVTLAIILSAMPQLGWVAIIPYTAPMALAFLMIGWGVDRFSYRHRTVSAISEGASLVVLVPLIGIVVLIPSVAFVLSHLLSVSMISALLIALPFIAGGWIVLQNLTSGISAALLVLRGQVLRQILPGLPLMRSEIAIFACSAFLGVMVAPLVDTDQVSDWIVRSGLSSGGVLTLTAWMITGLAVIGFNPIISVSIMVGVLPKLSAPVIDPLAIGCMAVCVWSVAVNLSPYSTAVRIAGRMIDENPARIGIVWNSLYSFACLLVLSVCLLVFA